MNDGNIQFPPGKRREAPKFEPPPWEREQFEELAKARQAQQAAEPEHEEPQQPDVPEAAEGEGEQSHAATEQGPEPEPAPATGQCVDDSSPATTPEHPVLDEAHVQLLLSGLRAEEPLAAETYWKLSFGVGLGLAVVGLVVTTWGVIIALTPTENGAAVAILVMGLLVPGLGFLGGGVWMVISSLRKQGVL